MLYTASLITATLVIPAKAGIQKDTGFPRIKYGAGLVKPGITNCIRLMSSCIKNKKGFTLIEVLLVTSLIGLMLSVSVPISYSMYMSYKASLKAEEVMIFISSLKRESFLYSEANILSSKDGVMTVNSKEKTFSNILIHIDPPIEFYKNGTTSGGTLKIYVGDQAYSLNVQAPFGELFLERKGKS